MKFDYVVFSCDLMSYRNQYKYNYILLSPFSSPKFELKTSHPCSLKLGNLTFEAPIDQIDLSNFLYIPNANPIIIDTGYLFENPFLSSKSSHVPKSQFLVSYMSRPWEVLS